jgi:hypothetical protein
MINSINLLENNINNSKIILKIEDNKNQGYLGELGRAYFIQSLLNIGLNKKSIIIEQNTDIGSGNNKKRADLFLKTKEIVTDKENEEKLFFSSITGKSGYPKLLKSQI